MLELGTAQKEKQLGLALSVLPKIRAGIGMGDASGH